MLMNYQGKNEPTSPHPQQFFVALIRGEGEVSPVCKKNGIIFNIEKCVGQNVLLTGRGEVAGGKLVRFCRYFYIDVQKIPALIDQ